MKKYSHLIIDTNEFYKSAFSIICTKNKDLSHQDIINKTIQLAFTMILKLKSQYLYDAGDLYIPQIDDVYLGTTYSANKIYVALLSNTTFTNSNWGMCLISIFLLYNSAFINPSALFKSFYNEAYTKSKNPIAASPI
jgi:hypothetical protein